VGGSVSCRCEVDGRGAGFPRAPEAPKLGSLCGVFLISDEAGAGPLPSTRIHADGLNPGPLPSTRMASPTPSPSPSLIKTRNTKTPIFGASAGRGNPAPRHHPHTHNQHLGLPWFPGTWNTLNNLPPPLPHTRTAGASSPHLSVALLRIFADFPLDIVSIVRVNSRIAISCFLTLRANPSGRRLKKA
jgi:hypothetical protein